MSPIHDQIIEQFNRWYISQRAGALMDKDAWQCRCGGVAYEALTSVGPKPIETYLGIRIIKDLSAEPLSLSFERKES